MGRPATVMLFMALALPLATSKLDDGPGAGDQSRHSGSGGSSKTDLEALKDNLAFIQDGLVHFQRRSCALGLNSHHCLVAQLNDVMRGNEYLSSGFSPGKRTVSLPEGVRTSAEALLNNLSKQMKAVNTLQALLEQIDQGVKEKVKRTCLVRLGNHCLTEALDRAANQYYYLQSPLSPGRKRRQIHHDSTANRRQGRLQ